MNAIKQAQRTPQVNAAGHIVDDRALLVARIAELEAALQLASSIWDDVGFPRVAADRIAKVRAALAKGQA